MIHADTKKYHAALAAGDRAICNLLSKEIARALPEAENKVWHAHPVWFLDGNPVVGYSKLKDCVRLLFWSGQSFRTKGLKKEGSFKAAEARYTAEAEVDETIDVVRGVMEGAAAPAVDIAVPLVVRAAQAASWAAAHWNSRRSGGAPITRSRRMGRCGTRRS